MTKRTLSLLFVLLTLMIPLFAQKSGAVTDRSYEKENKAYLTYDPIREGDVFWEKRLWRMIDYREKINQHFAYPRAPLAQLLTEAVLSGELQAFSALADDFSLEIASDQVRDKLASIDTIPIMDLETGEVTSYEAVQNEPDYKSFNKLLIKEDWIFDNQTSSLVVRIIGMAPVRQYTNPVTGERMGDEILFWLYYPEVVPYLAENEAFNPYNQGVQMSWYDVMEMRYFNSYIVKESNVHDRYIQDYASGVDVVLESERIKKEIFSFEHNLWEF